MSLFSFQGTADRFEFWKILILFSIIPAILLRVFGGSLIIFTSLLALFNVVGLIANVCVSVRRLHDRNKSGVWYFLLLVPIVGPIWYIVELGFLKGKPEGAQYDRMRSRFSPTLPLS
jgi:uncharacterized membrane protein YhaH (DUF805 family)